MACLKGHVMVEEKVKLKADELVSLRRWVYRTAVLMENWMVH